MNEFDLYVEEQEIINKSNNVFRLKTMGEIDRIKEFKEKKSQRMRSGFVDCETTERSLLISEVTKCLDGREYLRIEMIRRGSKGVKKLGYVNVEMHDLAFAIDSIILNLHTK